MGFGPSPVTDRLRPAADAQPVTRHLGPADFRLLRIVGVWIEKRTSKPCQHLTAFSSLVRRPFEPPARRGNSGEAWKIRRGVETPSLNKADTSQAISFPEENARTGCAGV